MAVIFHLLIVTSAAVLDVDSVSAAVVVYLVRLDAVEVTCF